MTLFGKIHIGGSVHNQAVLSIDPLNLQPSAQPPVRLVCVGHAAVDHHFVVDQFPSEATKTPAQSYHMLLGGMAANAAVAAARLGASVSFVGRVGADPNGYFLRTSLEAEGVDCIGLMHVQGKKTSVSSVVVDRTGERHIFNHRGNAITDNPPPLDIALLERADAILCDPRWECGALTALKWARANGVLSVLDGDIAPQAALQRLVGYCDWAAFSQGGLHSFAGSLVTLEALSLAHISGARQVLVTSGAAGLHWLNAGSLLHVPALCVAAQDTTGAGDVFHAALTVALAEGQAVGQALRFASTAAAMKCEKGDGVMGAPNRTALEMRLAELQLH